MADGLKYKDNQLKHAKYYKTNHLVRWKRTLKILLERFLWMCKQIKMNLKFSY